MEYKSTNHVTHSCKYRIVWCTKYKRAILTGEIKTKLEEMIKQICKEQTAEILEYKVEPNEVNLLLDVKPQNGIHQIVKKIKAKTSHDLRAEYEECKTRVPSLWTNSYFIATVGDVSESALEEFLEKQKNV